MKVQTQKLRDEKEEQLRAVNENLSELEKADFHTDKYRFETIAEFKRLKSDFKATEDALDKLKSNPSFIVLSDALDKAKSEYKEAQDNVIGCSIKISLCQKEIDDTKTAIDKIATEIFTAQNKLYGYELIHMDIKAAALQEYNKNLSGHEDGIVLSENNIKNAEKERSNVLEDLKKPQLNYCMSVGGDISKCGEEYIGYYRERKYELTNIEALETRQKLENTKRNLQSTLVTDFDIV